MDNQAQLAKRFAPVMFIYNEQYGLMFHVLCTNNVTIRLQGKHLLLGTKTTQKIYSNSMLLDCEETVTVVLLVFAMHVQQDINYSSSWRYCSLQNVSAMVFLPIKN